MIDEEKVKILKSTEKLWNEKNRLEELVKENAELKEKNKLLENTCDTWQEIQKTDNELLQELEKENTHLKAIWDSYIKKEEDWDKERHTWMQERFDFRNKIAELEKEKEQRKEQLTILERRIYNLKIKNAGLERKNEELSKLC